jgi:hypothetical protein
MIELKRQINQLCVEAGKSLVYDLTRVEQGDPEITAPA